MTVNTADTDRASKVAPVYLVYSGEIILDAPVKDAWRHVINYPSWQNFPIVEHVSGEPGHEGEVVLLKKEEAGLTIGPYYTRTIKLDPERRVIWKVYLAELENVQGTGGADITGWVEFRLYDDGENRSRFWYNLIYELLVPYEHESELGRYREQQDREYAPAIHIMMGHLKELVETGTVTR